MPDLVVPGVAAQTYAVGLPGWTPREAHNLRNVAAAAHVEAAVAVTILALNILLLMEGVLEVLGGIGMTARAGVTANFTCPREIDVGLISICRNGVLAGREL
jgi:hypothetical protein